MARSVRLSHIAAVLLVLGCATQEGAAQDGQQPRQRPGEQGAERPKKDEADEDDPRPYVARIQDRSPQDPFQLRKAVLFVPEVSLFGGGGGEASKTLQLKRGAAEIEVPFARLARLELSDSVKEEDDRLQVVVHLRAQEGQPAEQLQGTIRASLELRGLFQSTGLETAVKLREVRWLELQPAE